MKDKKAPEEMKVEKPFELDETVWLCPHKGDKEAVKIIGLPEDGSSKYMCLFKSGQEIPVNPCYLSR